VRFCFIRVLINDGVIDLKFSISDEQLDDTFIKSIKVSVFQNLRRLTGICTLDDPV